MSQDSPNSSRGTDDGPQTIPGEGHSAADVKAESPAQGPHTHLELDPPTFATGVRLVCLSFLMLFTELALIRWTAANNVHLAYVTNFVLLASFLGIGVGFLRAKSRHDLSLWAAPALAVLVAFVLAYPVKLTSLFTLQGRGGGAPLPKWISLPVIFVLTVLVMAGIGEGVARTFARFRPLSAYRLDIFGSIAGITVFSGMAFLDLPPVAWGAIAAAGFIVLLGRRRWWQVLATVVSLGLVMALLTVQSAVPNTYWSPYYKVTTTQPSPRVLRVWANNIPHQTAFSVTSSGRGSFYYLPYQHVNPASLNNVLVVGAGTGNDVAVALSEGAKHVDAVEIDPVLQRLGAAHHPDHPYQNPRVSAHITDGRAYLQQTHQRYDLILFALPDSLTLLPGQSNLRLENYLLTEQSMRAAKAHLHPTGTFAMYNYYEPFLLDRFAGTLAAVYGHPPCAEVSGKAVGDRQRAVLTSAISGPTPSCSTPWHGQASAPATDDHPFPYLPTNTIPPFYLWTLALILAASLLLVRTVGGPLRNMTRYLDLMFMGGAFLLLETKNVVQFALLFGTTWFVNSLVFAGVLLSVAAAIETARWLRLRPSPALYGALMAALAIAWLVPADSLLALSPVPRFAAAASVAFAPIFLANLVFAARFKGVQDSTSAFGGNLLGAMIGGALEYIALITGYRALLIVTAALYGLAFLVGRRSGTVKGLPS
ncbi:spermidine synthase [Streptomyces sp. NPDC046197]|uniref:spermidine synthase n=1 Tax=Streptomyces sp. NPDC046197 TaxID=3154337 RepID=UPI0033E346F8